MFSNIYEDLENAVTGNSIIYGWKKICFTIYLLHAIASKYSRRHFSFEKYKTRQSFKLHFLQNCPIVQLHSSVSDYKSVGNIPGSYFVKAFSALPSHS